MMDLDVSLLPTLATLLREANVTRAAARLAVTQPTMSVRLGRLREMLGDPLLVPSGHGRGMVLTPFAIQLRPAVDDALAAASAVLGRKAAFDIAASEAVIRILANDNAAALSLSVLLSAIASQEAPGLRIMLLRPDLRTIAERLETGDADLAIGMVEGLAGIDHLIQRLILADGFVTAQRKGHPRGAAPFDLDAFCGARHLLVSANAAGFSGAVDDALDRLGRTRKVVLTVHSYTLAPLIIAETDLTTTLPSKLMHRYDDCLDLFEPPLELGTFTPALLWHQRVHHDPVNRWVRDRIFAVGER